MSQYPNSYGYGQYHGQNPTQPPHPYGYQNFPGYAPPPYNAPYSSSATDFNRDASQTSFDYNATHIPGLAAPGPALSGTQYPTASAPAPWTQHTMFATLVSSAPPPHAYTPAPFHVQPSQTTQPGLTRSGADNATGTDVSKQTAPAAAHPSANVEIEEGELSEGQFEDLYETRESAREVVAQAISKSLSIVDQSQPTSAADTPEGGFYGTDEDDKDKGTGATEGRERSASYSPFLSPREIQSEVPTPQAVGEKGDGSSKPQPPVQLTSETLTTNGSSQPGSQKPGSPKDFLNSFKSLQEAKKEAQKAILRLWPLGVKYQNYIDEGFDEKFIKGLFQDLHLDMPKEEPPIQQAGEPKPRQDEPSSSTTSRQPSDAEPQQPASAPKETPAMSNQSGKGEERKDRIARLLAAKAAKAPVAPKPAPVATQPKPSVSEVQPQNADPAAAPSVPPKTKTWGEKERLLQQKIAALQKSREAQNQKSTAGTVDSGSASNRAPGPAQASPAVGPAPISIPTGPRASLSQTPVNTQSTPSQPRPFIPGLVLQSNSQPNPSSQRKRPVAADFVEYSSGSGVVKRPFGQARKETSLIIDVSDESGDEEMDIEMDMGSPVDEATPIQTSGFPAQRGPSIRDFPPLSDTFSPRRLASPVPSQTPPNGSANNKWREAELDMKEKAIQEMRKKIALAEAKRKAKLASGGSATSIQTGLTTPELKDDDATRLLSTGRVDATSSPDLNTPSSLETPEGSSERLPRALTASNLDTSQRAGRRGRIVSHDLPRVESSLEEKLARLRQLREEEARLQAEIDRSVAEKRLLNDELEQLDTTTSAESPQRNGLNSNNDSEASSSHSADNSANIQRKSPLTQSGSESGEIGDAPTNEASSSEAQSQGRSPSAELVESEPSAGKSISRSGVVQAGAGDASVSTESETNASTGLIDSALAAKDPRPSSQPFLPQSDVEAQMDAAMNSDLAPEPSEPNEANATFPTVPEPGQSRTDETTAMELDSGSSTSESAEAASVAVEAGELNELRLPSAPLPDQISSAAQPREDVQEIETETTGEVQGQSTTKSGSTLTPYESPLRYFHAYRFHPDYQGAVAGGLKSLTYSNRINPEKELCPFELNGEQCPAECEFQHFGAISPPDDLILLELGNPDDYSGEEKSRFIQGLRELLQRFKADKVRDFDTIARAIIEFRSRIVGDKTKILRLDGVTI